MSFPVAVNPEPITVTLPPAETVDGEKEEIAGPFI